MTAKVAVHYNYKNRTRVPLIDYFHDEDSKDFDESDNDEFCDESSKLSNFNNHLKFKQTICQKEFRKTPS